MLTVKTKREWSAGKPAPTKKQGKERGWAKGQDQGVGVVLRKNRGVFFAGSLYFIIFACQNARL